jgi:hypothetical protein
VKIDISVRATDSDNINRSGETASFLIFVEPVEDAPEEVVRSSSPYLNGKDVRDASGVQLQLFDATDDDDVQLMNVEFSCPYGIFSIPPQITRNSTLFVYTLKNSLEAENVLSIHPYASNLTSIVDSILFFTPISAYHGKDTINLRVTSQEPNLLDSTASMVLSRANAAGMSLKTGAVISSLPYIPGKNAIATADIFVIIPAMLSLSCVASAKLMEDSSFVRAEACWFDSRAFEERFASAEVLVAVAVNDGLSVSSLSKEAETETKLSSLSTTVSQRIFHGHTSVRTKTSMDRLHCT